MLAWRDEALRDGVLYSLARLKAICTAVVFADVQRSAATMSPGCRKTPPKGVEQKHRIFLRESWSVAVASQYDECSVGAFRRRRPDRHVPLPIHQPDPVVQPPKNPNIPEDRPHIPLLEPPPHLLPDEFSRTRRRLGGPRRKGSRRETGGGGCRRRSQG